MAGEGFKIEKLTADNFHSWKFNMKMYLIGKDLWDLVQGVEVLDRTAEEDEKKKFRKRDNLSLSIICLSVSSDLQIYVRNANTGKEAWESLSGHFEEKTLSKKIFYRRKLYSIRLEKGTTMTTHVNKLKTISEHLEALDDAVQEKDLVMILISSLPDEYNNLITAMETLKEEKLTWCYVRDRLLSEYARKRGVVDDSGCDDKENNPDALFTGGDNRKSSQKFVKKCHYCGVAGHIIRNCHKKKSDDAEKKKESDEYAAFCRDNSIKPEFALQVDRDDDNGDSWWLDSGCSQHMTWVRNDFSSFQKFKSPLDIILADRSIVHAIGRGDVYVNLVDKSNNAFPIVLKNVLFIPKLRKRLVSISIITESRKEVTFRNNTCSILIDQKEYMLGHKHGKLWRLCTVAACNSRKKKIDHKIHSMFAESNPSYLNSVGEISCNSKNSKFKWELYDDISVNLEFDSKVTDYDAEAKKSEAVATIEDINVDNQIDELEEFEDIKDTKEIDVDDQMEDLKDIILTDNVDDQIAEFEEDINSKENFPKWESSAFNDSFIGIDLIPVGVSLLGDLYWDTSLKLLYYAVFRFRFHGFSREFCCRIRLLEYSRVEFNVDWGEMNLFCLDQPCSRKVEFSGMKLDDCCTDTLTAFQKGISRFQPMCVNSSVTIYCIDIHICRNEWECWN